MPYFDSIRLIGYGYDIKPNIARPIMGKNVMPGCASNMVTFGTVNKNFRKTEGHTGTHFYFYKNKPIFPEGNQIDLTVLEAEISFKDSKAFFNEKISGKVFGFVSFFDFFSHETTFTKIQSGVHRTFSHNTVIYGENHQE